MLRGKAEKIFSKKIRDNDRDPTCSSARLPFLYSSDSGGGQSSFDYRDYRRVKNNLADIPNWHRVRSSKYARST